MTIASYEVQTRMYRIRLRKQKGGHCGKVAISRVSIMLFLQHQLTLNRRGWFTLILRSLINPPSQFLSFHILEFLDLPTPFVL